MALNTFTTVGGGVGSTIPAPQAGVGPYGAVPGPIAIPPSTYEQVGAVYPGLAGQLGAASANINAGLMGELSPATIAQLQRHAAQFGQQIGMPLSGLATNAGLLSLGQNVEARQDQALKEYLALTQGVGSMMTPQALAAEIANRNAVNAAAPDPREAALQMLQDWMTKFNMTQAAANANQKMYGGKQVVGGPSGYTPPTSGTSPYAGLNIATPRYNTPSATNWEDVLSGPTLDTRYIESPGGEVAAYDPYAQFVESGTGYNVGPASGTPDWSTEDLAAAGWGEFDWGGDMGGAPSIYMGSLEGYNPQ